MLHQEEIKEALEFLQGTHSTEALSFAKNQVSFFYSMNEDLKKSVNNACNIIINKDQNITLYYNNTYNHIEKSLSQIAAFYDLGMFK
jgi:hypothetical protein